ncbi:MAG: DUF86 domain-containing protein [Spirochaetales bacterium]|nr:DUF86 domain-containing protein [Spirochaetales bacterium]
MSTREKWGGFERISWNYRDSILRCLEVIGEATKRLPDSLREKNPDIPWKAMAGMKDRLIHGYDVVDPEIIWITVSKTIPEILPKIQGLKEKI